MGHDRGAGAHRQVGAQLRPPVVLGDHLGERANREQAGVVGDHRRRPLRWGDEGKAVLGQCRRWPQLPPGGHGGAAPVTSDAQAAPVA